MTHSWNTGNIFRRSLTDGGTMLIEVRLVYLEIRRLPDENPAAQAQMKIKILEKVGKKSSFLPLF